ncbi:MAG TPA: 3-deoxy-7-phosphoheptulonate synthase [Anaerolineaceae bacterium]|nr:3-deoxy-7-phosphoheptulonate synthase [Anaerolineaceae bacterium]HPN52631.1 3-deoxy-7-phosphoheptulonate synthase [Anaerolineaceae bacterium]
MLIIMKVDAAPQEIAAVVERIEISGLKAHLSQGKERTIIGAIGDTRIARQESFTQFPGVDRIMPISRPYKLCSREFCPEDSTFKVQNVAIGGPQITIIAGPCSVESRSQMLEIAHAVKEAGAHMLRGGAFKPRTSPYAFQGMGEAGLELLAEAGRLTGLPTVTEVMATDQVELIASYTDMLQIGARNMQNFALLHAAGESQHPILLKRGMSATIEELLMAAEYILSHNNRRVILCERGIRTFETATRNTTDINAIPVLKSLSHLPVILDPSHSTGNWQYVSAVARAAVAAGADGLIVEVHQAPEQALSDGGQSLKPERFAAMVRQVRAIAEAVGRFVPASNQAISLSEISLPAVVEA